MSRPARGPRPAKIQEWSDRLGRFHLAWLEPSQCVGMRTGQMGTESAKQFDDRGGTVHVTACHRAVLPRFSWAGTFGADGPPAK